MARALPLIILVGVVGAVALVAVIALLNGPGSTRISGDSFSDSSNTLGLVTGTAAGNTCPIDGTPFNPSDPDFLGLVGNELQIALYYQASIPYLADKYADANVKKVRIILNWKEIESTDDQYSWGYADTLISEFSQQGVDPVGIISVTPRWASSCPDDPYFSQCIAANLTEYQEFIRAAVRRYGPAGTDAINDWEIRVEANTNRGRLTKEQYVQELNTAYVTIHQQDPDARVWGPEVVFHRNNDAYPDGGAYQWVDYVIAHGRYDVFSIHHFDTLTSAYTHTRRVRKKLDTAGQQDIPLAVSAMNYAYARSSPPLTQQEQARRLRELYACVSSAGADHAMWFAGTEWNANISLIEQDTQYGIFDYDFTIPERVKPKLSYDALKALGDSMDDDPPVPPPSTMRRMPVACVPGGQPALVSQDFLGMGMKEAGPWLNVLTNTTFIEWMTEELDAAGVQSTITGVGWASSEPQNNTFNWVNDPVISNLTRAGIRPIAALSNTPTWASSNPTSDNPGAYPPRSMDDWRDAVRQAVRHYGPTGNNQVHDWKIWNEPNGAGFWRGTREEFTALLNAGYVTIKQEDPTAKVWAPGIVYHENNKASTGYNNPDAWVDHIIAHGRFDVLTIHLYYRNPVEMRDTIRRVRQKLDAAGKQNIPIAVTEFNIFDNDGVHCPYGNLTEAQQAQNLRRAYACVADGGAASAYWFTATDRPSNNPAIICPGGWIRSGVFTRSPVAEKLSYDALREIGVALGTAKPEPTNACSAGKQPLRYNAGGSALIWTTEGAYSPDGKTSLWTTGEPGKCCNKGTQCAFPAGCQNDGALMGNYSYLCATDQDQGVIFGCTDDASHLDGDELFGDAAYCCSKYSAEYNQGPKRFHVLPGQRRFGDATLDAKREITRPGYDACADGSDNDCDGFVDLQDSDCAMGWATS